MASVLGITCKLKNNGWEKVEMVECDFNIVRV